MGQEDSAIDPAPEKKEGNAEEGEAEKEANEINTESNEPDMMA